jgi:hypothetical protein
MLLFRPMLITSININNVKSDLQKEYYILLLLLIIYYNRMSCYIRILTKFKLLRYKQEILVDGDPVIFEICDTCCKVGYFLLQNTK